MLEYILPLLIVFVLGLLFYIFIIHDLQVDSRKAEESKIRGIDNLDCNILLSILEKNKDYWIKEPHYNEVEKRAEELHCK